MIETLEKRLKAIKRIILRNREMKPDQCLSFPFFLVTRNDGTTLFDVIVEENEKKVTFKSSKKMTLLGDLDICSL